MWIDNFYPEPDKFFQLEGDSIKKALNCSPLCSKFPGLWSDLTILCYEINNSGILNFTNHLSLIGPKGADLFVIFGGIILTDEESNFESTSYKVLIINKTEEKILKAVHYDFEPIAKRNEDEAKPSMHIQVGGDIEPFINYANEKLNLNLDGNSYDSDSYAYEKVRISFHPISLILLLNSIFLEFVHLDKIEAIVKDPTWRKTICELERNLLKKYFNFGSELLNKDHNNIPLSYTYYNL